MDAQDYVAVAAASESVLDEVDGALARLAAGTYGRCEACGQEISQLRLDALPLARTCDNHPQLTDGSPPST